VVIANFAFTPQNITIAAGARVRWVNRDTTTHTVTSNDGTSFNTTLSPGQSFVWTPTGIPAGTIVSYHCNIHTTMTGSVQVSLPPDPTITPTNITPSPVATTAVPPTTPPGSLTVQIKNNGAETNQQTPFAYVVKNTSTSAKTGVTVRIYFTLDGTNAASNYTLEKYFDLRCGNDCCSNTSVR